MLITHYQRLLDYIKPDFVHIMYKGEIVRRGLPTLSFLGDTRHALLTLSFLVARDMPSSPYPPLVTRGMPSSPSVPW